MESEEVIKLVDEIYKNILEKFNPGARQLISAGKAYLKALHGAAAASRIFNEALAKIANNAQEGGTADIGSALMNIVDVYKGIQDQQMNILKAFYVDLLVPLETNLEKDTKVVQFEQKKFLQHHKARTDSYSKAAATMKKQRKKKNNSHTTDKDIKNIQALEEQKNKLDVFCEQSFKNAMTQERRRYGFVLERQCSLAKHWIAYYSAGKKTIETNLDTWIDIAASREALPSNIDNIFAKRMAEKMRQDDENMSVTSALRKTQSVDASCLDMRSLGDLGRTTMCMPRAKSEFNLTSSVAENENWDQRPVAKALYAYLSSGENQLSFLEGDRIALVGNRAKGWQFGENLRTQMFGWFPVAYTELENSDHKENIYDVRQYQMNGNHGKYTPDSSLESTLIDETSTLKRNSYHTEPSPTRMFGDTIMFRQSKHFHRNSSSNPKPGPPPALPAPVPAPIVPAFTKSHISQSRSFCSPVGPPLIEKRRSGPPVNNHAKVINHRSKREGATNASLHSSNDSGFANEPPPQPEVDYSDEEQSNRVPIRSSRSRPRTYDTTGRSVPSYFSDSNTLKRSYQSQNTSTPKNYSKEDDAIDYQTTDRKGNIIKRTKSFWKFGKSDDILAGMSMWKHRDLVQVEKERLERAERETLQNNIKNREQSEEYDEMKKVSPEKQIKGTELILHSSMPHENQQNDEDENIYDIHQTRQTTNIITSSHTMKSTKSNNNNNNNNNNTNNKNKKPQEMYNNKYHESRVEQKDYRKRQQMYYENNLNNPKHQSHHTNMDDKSSMDDDNEDAETLTMHNNNFFDDESVEEMVMKTVKRHEILKQYDSSGTDTERNSSSSDPYDCIVVDDHLVRKGRNNRHLDENKMEFKTFRDSNQSEKNVEIPVSSTLLPRTKLNKPMINTHSQETTLHIEQLQNKEQNDHDRNYKNGKDTSSTKSYGPWYDLWGKEQNGQKA